MYRHLFAALLLSVTSLCAKGQVNAEQVLSIGRNVLSMEDYVLSIQYFNLAIKAKPYLADPYFFRGLAKLYLDDFKGAENDCSIAIEKNKFKTEAYKVRGFARQQLGRDSLAIEDYNKGLYYSPHDKYFLFYKAIAQTELRDTAGAMQTFSTLLKTYPKFDDGYTALARLRLEMADTTGALDNIGKAIGISRNQVNSYLMRAEILARRNRWEEAASDMDEAIRLRPQEGDLYINRAYIRYNSGDYFGAMSDYNYAVELNPRNAVALFNRGLLRYEVKDLRPAADDFSTVLDINPENFHARYNRGLVWMELGQYNKALADFNIIAGKYPKYYPIYYAIGETRRSMGDLRGAADNFNKADVLVRKYVSNPLKNPLDRPTIDAGKTYSDNATSGDESEIDVMDRFNQLVTVSSSQESRLAYNEKISGKVQDRNVRIEIEPSFLISYYNTAGSLKNQSNYFHELDNINRNHWLDYNLYLTNNASTLSEQSDIQRIFDLIDDLTTAIESKGHRPVDYFGRAIAQSTIKNYQAAIADLDTTLSSNPNFTPALLTRALCYTSEAEMLNHKTDSQEDDALLAMQQRSSLLQKAIADYDAAITLNPRLIYALFNKGNILYSMRDFTSALNCYSSAIAVNPEFGEAYFNRGLTYMQLGDKTRGNADLSKAGELGILQAYNVLKRMK